MNMKVKKPMTVRAFLEFKNGSFKSTQEVLRQPDTWENLTPACKRLIKRYAARLENTAFN